MQIKIRNYTVQNIIGKGANAFVYYVQDEKFNQYALKAQSKITDIEKKLNDFIQNIKFQNVINTYEQFSYNEGLIDYFIIIMDYCNIGDLYKYLQQQYAYLNNQHRKDMLFQIAFGIWEIHTVDIIHRDIKPSNILIQLVDQNNYVIKICDLGLSKTHQVDILHTMNIGTPCYMAPEQIDSSQKKATYDKSVDVWAFGALIYDFFSNQQLFFGNGIYQIFEQIQQGTNILQKLQEKISDQQLLEIAVSCLQQKPSDRPNIEQILLKLNPSLFQTKSQKFFQENKNFQQQQSCSCSCSCSEIQQVNLSVQQNYQQPNQNIEQNSIQQSTTQIQQNCLQQSDSETQLNQVQQPILLENQLKKTSQLELPTKINKTSDSNQQIQIIQSQDYQQDEIIQQKKESLNQQNYQQPNQNEEQNSIQQSIPQVQQNCLEEPNSDTQLNQLQQPVFLEKSQNKESLQEFPNNQINQNDQNIQSELVIEKNEKKIPTPKQIDDINIVPSSKVQSKLKSNNYIKNQVKLRTRFHNQNLIDKLCQNIDEGFSKNQIENYLNNQLEEILEQQLFQVNQ
ncbi:unnamed protein product [Paramecium sonneborni]|uniref:Protein kinase domain-containing protein n=1 Tax=Paramecium sonneborni TaxID=65129 RepID=A0A8S1L1Y0_9CILI|nr:unnamed protein product [Paramecium sonneborni]